MAEAYDLIVIGSGPGGESAAAQAAALGKRVALIEREPHLGGSGLNTGTMPSKMLRETALYLAGLRQRELYGIDYSLHAELNLADLLYRKDVVIQAAWAMIQRNLERLNIHIVRGSASLAGAHTVHVSHADEDGPHEIELQGEVIVIATGAVPRHPAGVPTAHPRVLDAVNILRLERVPKSLVVCGGGTVGCEYASIFAALGCQVTLVEARERVLTFVDGEIVTRWQRHQERLGMQLVLRQDVTEAQPGPHAVRVRLSGGAELTADAILFAMGRRGNVHGLGLEAAGVQLTPDGELIVVNERFQTSVPSIYAVGDVVGFPALASTSAEQGRTAARHAFHAPGAPAPLPASVYPLAVYTVPEIAMAGLAEEDCREKNIPYLVGRGYFDRNPRALITGDTFGLLKLIFEPEDRRLLGVHIVGEQAAELVHLGAQVLATGGTLDAFTQAVFNYPTLSEAYKSAAYDGLERWEQARAAPA